MVLFTVIATLGALTILFIIFSKWRYLYWSRRGVPQFKPSLIFGDFGAIFTQSVAAQEHFLNMYKKSKAKGWSSIGFYNFLSAEWMPLDLEVIKNIFVKDLDYFPGHGMYHHKDEPLTENLFNLDGEDWKKLRIKLSPTFTTGKMKMMFETLLEKANVLHKVVNGFAENDKQIHIKETLARFGTDVIGSVAFGIECNTLEEPNNQFREMGKKTFEPSLFKFLLEQLIPFKILGKLGYKFFPRSASAYFTEITKETIKYREQNNIQRNDVMHLMLQLKHRSDKELSLTDQEIITESFLFYGAGFETSSTATTFALLELAQNQDIQDKLRQEIHEVLEKHDDKLTYDVVMEMEYLDKVMHEALRRYPPASFIPRLCVKSYKVPGYDLVIEKGTKVYLPAWGVHMDPEYYPNPEVFNPENFSAENKSKRPNFTWFPFGEGPRICIGLRFGMMESKVALITLLKDFRLFPHKTMKYPLEMDSGSVVLSVKGEVLLSIEKL